jgi:hypothetical protein
MIILLGLAWMISPDERVGSRFAQIQRDRIDRAGCIGNFRITLFAQDLIKGGIDRKNAMSVFAQKLQSLVGVTIRLRRREWYSSLLNRKPESEKLSSSAPAMRIDSGCCVSTILL